MSNFHPIEVVALVSEAQLQLDEHFNYLIKSFKGYGSQKKNYNENS